MRIAAFQRFAIFDDPAEVAQNLRRDLVTADQQGVDLAVFPESYFQGPSYGRQLIERRAESLDGPAIRKLVNSLSDIKATVILGLFERRQKLIFNSAAVIETGRIAGVYAKASPIEDGCSPGTQYPVWNKGKWRFGINICNDMNFPHNVEDQLTLQSVNIVCVPINNMLRPRKAEMWRVRSVENLQACAQRTRCWVVSADVTGRRHDGWLSYGCTVIVRPDGTIASRATELSEDVAIIDLP
jgi:5-aminopentanamidase